MIEQCCNAGVKQTRYVHQSVIFLRLYYFKTKNKKTFCLFKARLYPRHYKQHCYLCLWLYISNVNQQRCEKFQFSLSLIGYCKISIPSDMPVIANKFIWLLQFSITDTKWHIAMLAQITLSNGPVLCILFHRNTIQRGKLI